MHFEVDSSPVGNGHALRVAVHGELDIASSERLKRAADAAIVGIQPLILDLADCSFIDSRGLGLILQIHKELSDRGGPSVGMAIVIGESVTRRLFTLTAIDRTVPLFPTLERAGVWLDTQRRSNGTQSSAKLA
jgi:anti-sigma B factor antagonist